MEKLKATGQIAIAFGLIYLASAVLYFAIEAGKIRQQIPLILAGLEDGEGAGDGHPLLTRIDKALLELPLVRSEIEGLRLQVPQILKESAAIRTLVPDVLGEMKEVREAMVPVLAESAALRAELPAIIRGAKGVSKNVGAGAAQGAMEGTVKGIVGAPFEVLKQGADLITPGSGGDKDDKDEKPTNLPQEE